MSTQKFMDSAGIKHLWEKIMQAMGGVSDIEADVEALANALGSKITLIPYTNITASSNYYYLPVSNIGELRIYSVTANNTASRIFLPQGGRYIAYQKDATPSFFIPQILSGGTQLYYDLSKNFTVDLFYLRIE